MPTQPCRDGAARVGPEVVVEAPRSELFQHGHHFWGLQRSAELAHHAVVGPQPMVRESSTLRLRRALSTAGPDRSVKSVLG